MNLHIIIYTKEFLLPLFVDMQGKIPEILRW